MISCVTLAMLCLLFGCLIVTGESAGSKLKAPELNIKRKELIIQAGETIHLTCRGEEKLTWTFPAITKRQNTRLNITESVCERHQKRICRSLTLRKAQISDTGFYRCTYLDDSRTSAGRNIASIYIFIADPNHPFVEMEKEIPPIIYMTEGKELVIPCRVTSPNIAVTLKTYSNEIFTPDGKHVIWDNKRGFRIPKPTYKFIDLLICEATVNGRVHSTKYLTNRQSSAIHKVQLSVPSSVRLLKGTAFSINCTVTTDLNARAEINWKYPRQKHNKIATIMRGLDLKTKTIMVSSILYIPEMNYIDNGTYICNVRNGPSSRSVNTMVRVIAKPFINVKPRKKSVLEVMAGQKSYRISMKVRAFPSPEVRWLKDDLLAADKCARYIVHNNYLIIKDVSEEDAGNYTIVLQLKKWNLIKKLTVTLTVNVKPQIYEKSVSFHESHIYPLRSRQTLTCTVYGVPTPTITWIWQPCRLDHSKARCDPDLGDDIFHLSAGRNSSNVGNKIKSITERTQMIEGKMKTAGFLVIEDSTASGIYTCLATNKVGSDIRNIRYFVTDVHNGFHVTADKVPNEGEDFTLSCSVNRYLYTDITWILLRSIGDPTMHRSISKQKNAITTEYSTTLTVNIKNATQADSGIYVCRATNIFTRQVSQQRQEIIVRGEDCNKQVLFSRTFKLKRRKSMCPTESTVIS
ncbi:vascular endothelial growth factor receptor 1 [Bombina bombina]|uniref:vascular endothelial growth factor receptor 1 n=1 Tax=Bombina bombina TaxID=8345 RepID=UPI00235B2351|nr:vascular endothelial growth factor receptor 1 [Bombina bombina]